ncbi:ABC transporter permease [Erysipelothrix enhydrae]|uniref:ABC transporter permease n=1 Tax=Erysipelothrix enhydrae TaxID=2890314 RepID=UPI002B24C46D|nr:ABC transporter permease [Erysipelothrix sp. 4322-04]WRB86963.1 ABC transporter permease [Erysipelothrix sp. 4322-04]
MAKTSSIGTKIKKIFANEGNHAVIASFLAIIIGLFVGFLVILLTTPQYALSAFWIILKGGFHHNLRGMGNVLFRAAPIILTGLSVGFAFKTGLFNIGASGQFTVGAFTAVYIGVNWTWMPAGTGWIVGLIGGALAGALWGAIVGVLKAYRNVNEVIASIMLNYIGMYAVNYLITNTAFDSVHSRTLPPVNAYLPVLGLNKIFPRSSVNIGIVIAIVMAILLYIVLEKTKFGFELKAVGYNRHASRYAGINEKKSIILSMTIAGALAGLGGAVMYLANVGKYMDVLNVLLTEGFDGISVALLAQSNPIGIILSGLFIAHITYGGNNLQLFGLEPEIISVITATIIYVSALTILLKGFIAKVTKNSGGDN